MQHTLVISLVVAAIVIGLSVRLALLAIGAARLRIVPRRWQRWIMGDSPKPHPRD